jgi:hypothetical protein
MKREHPRIRAMTKAALLATCLCFVLGSALAAENGTARTWTPETRDLHLADNDLQTDLYEVLCSGPEHDPCDAGLEWKSPQRVDRLTVSYASLFGRIYEPAFAGQQAEYWDGTAWQSLHASIHIDDTNRAIYAPVQQFGSVTWEYVFKPVTTTRLRVRLFQPENPDSGHRCYAVRRIQAGLGGSSSPKGSASMPGHPSISGLASAMPDWLHDGGNLSADASGVVMTRGKAAELHWPKPLLMNQVTIRPMQDVASVEWWDGASWRPVEKDGIEHRGEVEFLPVASAGLRIHAAESIASAQVSLNSNASRYFSEVEAARSDLLGDRFRRMADGDLNGMRGLMLPADFYKTAIGRPGDEEETIVLWNGTVLQFEGNKRAAPLDRWFVASIVSAKGALMPGEEWNRTQTRYLNGFLPATVTTSTLDRLAFEQTVYVTSPDDALYGTVVEISIANNGPGLRQHVPFALAMGRRENQHQVRPIKSVFAFAPKPVGYQSAPGGHTVRLSTGELVLYAEQGGVWETTGLEDHLKYDLSLRAGERRTLRFFIPAPGSPGETGNSLEGRDWAASRARFEKWWTSYLNSGMRLDLPEPELNNIYRSLLAQSLIITRDGDDRVAYGAYFYESYFGIEEGWPAVALAQYGFGDEAQKILSIMLSPKLMEKKGQHYQYRNGLDPWYAIWIYRLTGDRSWLETIAPVLKESADWTVRVTEENHDPKYPGILPRHTYGGDIRTPAYSLYANATCWRGLHDTALAFRALNQEDLAGRYAQAAEEYRKRLLAITDQIADKQSVPVFVPMSFELGSLATGDYKEREPTYPFLSPDVPASDTWGYLANYWNLFAPMILEVKLFPEGDPKASWIPRYIEQRGGLIAGQTRFLAGLDQEYGKGYYESLVESADRPGFLTSLYGVLAHGMSSNLYSFPEVAGVFPTRTSNEANWREHMRELWNWYFVWDFSGWHTTEGDPLSAAPGMALQLMRMALLRETTETDAQDTLRLLDGAPRRWFLPGKKIAVENAPTFFGHCSFSIDSTVGAIRARVRRDPDFRARATILRLPSPESRPIRAVRVNNQDFKDFSDDEIRLPAGAEVDVVATY